MSTRFASFAFALLAVTVGCSSSTASPTTSTPSDAGADTRPPDPTSNEAFFEAAAEPICQRMFHCCTTAEERDGLWFYFGLESTPTDVASCTTAMKAGLANFAGFVAPSFAAGRLEFVPSAAGDCLATLRASAETCEGLIVEGELAPMLACPKAYAPKVAIGGDCIVSTECVDSVCRPTDAARTKGTCQPRGKEGDFCLGDSCEAGLVCSELVDGACVGSSKSSVCRKPAANGTLCCSDADCIGDCYAEGDETQPVCRPELPTTPAPDGACDGK